MNLNNENSSEFGNFDLRSNERNIQKTRRFMASGVLVSVIGLVIAVLIPPESGGGANPIQTYELLFTGFVGIILLIVGYIFQRRAYLISNVRTDIELSGSAKRNRTRFRILLIVGIVLILIPGSIHGLIVIGIIVLSFGLYYESKVSKERRAKKIKHLTGENV